MKIWHAVCFAAVIMFGAQALVQKRGGTSMVEDAQVTMESRSHEEKGAASPAQPTPAPTNSAPDSDWYAADGDSDPSSDGGDFNSDYADDSGQQFGAQASPAGPAAATSQPVSAVSGAALAKPQTELLE